MRWVLSRLSPAGLQRERHWCQFGAIVVVTFERRIKQMMNNPYMKSRSLCQMSNSSGGAGLWGVSWKHFNHHHSTLSNNAGWSEHKVVCNHKGGMRLSWCHCSYNRLQALNLLSHKSCGRGCSSKFQLVEHKQEIFRKVRMLPYCVCVCVFQEIFNNLSWNCF